jgi:hypothetical protein
VTRIVLGPLSVAFDRLEAVRSSWFVVRGLSFIELRATNNELLTMDNGPRTTDNG